MYRIRTRGYSSRNHAIRWALPDRVFFACGACHILAYAFLERYGSPEMKALWLKPKPGFIGNHIFVATEVWVFDYHGYSRRDRFLAHAFRRARHYLSNWDAGGEVPDLRGPLAMRARAIPARCHAAGSCVARALPGAAVLAGRQVRRVAASEACSLSRRLALHGRYARARVVSSALR
jgi:hypothetical protein